MTIAQRPLPARSTLARVRADLLGWYAVEKRDFPWRQTRDPWAVLVSEMMLQQTQASRVAERFPTFLRRFATPAAMAAATDADVLAAWSGLGYNRRATALRGAAAQIAASGWPREVAGLERLPGVGPYTARAVAALAFGQRAGAVDTNVRRWLVRRFSLDPAAPPAELQAMADALANAGSAADAGSWMHASMEFGARVCSARRPACETCPLAPGCPSRHRAAHVPVPRQPEYAGSTRQLRGRVLRALASAPAHRLPLSNLRQGAGGAQLDAVLTALEAERLVHRMNGAVRLGAADPVPAVATIEP